MPVLRPFRAWRYADAPALADLLVPPYDIISPAAQAAFYARHPANLIQIELGLEQPADDDQNNRYTRAAVALNDWRQRRVLQRDPWPTFYIYQQTFRLPGSAERLQRTGFFGSLRLAPWGQGILPHEKTFPGAKADRLALLQATAMQTGAIFTLFRDPSGAVLNALRPLTSAMPIAAFVADDGIEHRLWPLHDPALITYVAETLAGRTLYVADGHHRYETALNYQQQRGDGGGEQPWDYVLTFAAPIEDPGVRVLAAHRCLHDVPGLWSEDVLAALQSGFEIQRYAAADALAAALRQAMPGAGYFGLLLPGTTGGWLLRPQPHLTLPADLPAELADLDVIRLQEWVLRPVLRHITDDLADKRFVAYEPNLDQVIEAVQQGQIQAAFLLNPTGLHQLCAVADAGLVMPQKATYFYPKLISGIVMHDVAS
ncbi:MAG: DUF1015 domain-containing protein [Anaerolineae bacterium]